MVGNQLCYEDVKENMEIPQLEVLCDSLSQVKWAGVNKDYDPEHYDKDYASSLGLSNCIVNGQFKTSLLTRMLLDWIGNDGSIQKLSCQHKKMDMVGEVITFKGVVKGRIQEGEDYLVDCEIWAENPKGEKTVLGSAVVALPSRSRYSDV
ncbi:MaoC/PaaZ C-terminal domain-containing protein [Chloroflexota bacterium]